MAWKNLGLASMGSIVIAVTAMACAAPEEASATSATADLREDGPRTDVRSDELRLLVQDPNHPSGPKLCVVHEPASDAKQRLGKLKAVTCTNDPWTAAQSQIWRKLEAAGGGFRLAHSDGFYLNVLARATVTMGHEPSGGSFAIRTSATGSRLVAASPLGELCLTANPSSADITLSADLIAGAGDEACSAIELQAPKQVFPDVDVDGVRRITSRLAGGEACVATSECGDHTACLSGACGEVAYPGDTCFHVGAPMTELFCTDGTKCTWDPPVDPAFPHIYAKHCR